MAGLSCLGAIIGEVSSDFFSLAAVFNDPWFGEGSKRHYDIMRMVDSIWSQTSFVDLNLNLETQSGRLGCLKLRLTLDRAGNLIACQSRDDDQSSCGQAGSPVKLIIS